MNTNVLFFNVSGQLRPCSRVLYGPLEGPKPPPDFTSDGCSGSPDAFLGRKLWPACHIHDYHYQTGAVGGTWAARQRSDAILRRNLRRLARAQGLSIPASARLAWAYWGRVRIWGASAYRCWAPGEAPQGRSQLLREAWGLFRPKG